MRHSESSLRVVTPSRHSESPLRVTNPSRPFSAAGPGGGRRGAALTGGWCRHRHRCRPAEHGHLRARARAHTHTHTHTHTCEHMHKLTKQARLDPAEDGTRTETGAVRRDDHAHARAKRVQTRTSAPFARVDVAADLVAGRIPACVHGKSREDAPTNGTRANIQKERCARARIYRRLGSFLAPCPALRYEAVLLLASYIGPLFLYSQGSDACTARCTVQ